MKITFKELFGWNISNVSMPVKKHELVEGKLEYVGYDVCAEYRNVNTGRTRQETVHFAYDDERMYTLYNGPEDAAKQYYASLLRKMQRQQARTVARQK